MRRLDLTSRRPAESCAACLAADIPASATSYECASVRGDSPWLFFGDLTAPAQNFCFCAGGFRFLDVASAIVKQRKTCPADLVVRPQFYRSFAGLDCFIESAELHQRHPERVPAIEKIGIKLHASPVFLDRAAQIADGYVAAGVVKNVGWRCHLFFSLNDHNGHKEIAKKNIEATITLCPLWSLCKDR